MKAKKAKGFFVTRKADELSKCIKCGSPMKKTDTAKVDHHFMVTYLCKKCGITHKEMEKV